MGPIPTSTSANTPDPTSTITTTIKRLTSAISTLMRFSRFVPDAPSPYLSEKSYKMFATVLAENVTKFFEKINKN